MSRALAQFGIESMSVRKRVLYEGTSTITEGMPVAYNYDTTTNILGLNKADNTEGTTTADGYLNEGKFLRVEDVTAANSFAFAGVVASGSWNGETGDGATWLEIYVPNGAIVACYTDKSVTVKDDMYLEPGQLTLSNLPDGKHVGVAFETVDRSSTNGLVLVQLDRPLEAAGGFVARGRAATALPTSAIWDNFDLASLKAIGGGVVLDADFTKAEDAPTDQFADTAMSSLVLPGTAGIGVLNNFTTTDNLAAEAQWNVPVKMDGGKWAFEARVAVDTIADTEAGFVLGLGVRTAALAGDVIADDGTITDGGYLGFQRKEADGDIVDFVYDEASQTQNEHDADYHTLVADAYVTLGMYYNGTTIQGYLNGVATGTAISAVDIAAADFPTTKILVPTFAQKSTTGAADVNVTLDWIRVAQVPS